MTVDLLDLAENIVRNINHNGAMDDDAQDADSMDCPYMGLE